MRTWLVLVLVACVGCTDAPDAGVPSGPSEPPARSDNATASVLRLVNATLAADAPGGDGMVEFTVPSSGYQQVFVGTPDPVLIQGDVRIALVGPDEEHVWLEGFVLLDETAGTPAVGGCGECTFRAPAVGGDWTLTWRIDGRIDMPLIIEAI